MSDCVIKTWRVSVLIISTLIIATGVLSVVLAVQSLQLDPNTSLRNSFITLLVLFSVVAAFLIIAAVIDFVSPTLGYRLRVSEMMMGAKFDGVNLAPIFEEVGYVPKSQI